MCGSEQREILGRRLNTSQGLRPRRKIGISTTIVRCRKCGLIYPDPLPVPQNLADHYSVTPETYFHADQIPETSDHFQWPITRLRQLAPDARSFLDIGAGIGRTMNAVERAGFDAFGIEPGEFFYQRALENGVASDRLTLTSIEDADFPASSFDIVSFGVVLEHLQDPSAALAKAITWLKPGGIVHLDVPNAGYLFSKLFNIYFRLIGTDFVVNASPMHIPFHIYEFTERSFVENGLRTGYQVRLLDRYAGVTPIAPKLSSLLAPVMNFTETGLGLILYLQKS